MTRNRRNVIWVRWGAMNPGFEPVGAMGDIDTLTVPESSFLSLRCWPDRKYRTHRTCRLKAPFHRTRGSGGLFHAWNIGERAGTRRMRTVRRGAESVQGTAERSSSRATPRTPARGERRDAPRATTRPAGSGRDAAALADLALEVQVAESAAVGSISTPGGSLSPALTAADEPTSRVLRATWTQTWTDEPTTALDCTLPTSLPSPRGGRHVDAARAASLPSASLDPAAARSRPAPTDPLTHAIFSQPPFWRSGPPSAARSEVVRPFEPEGPAGRALPLSAALPSSALPTPVPSASRATRAAGAALPRRTWTPVHPAFRSATEMSLPGTRQFPPSNPTGHGVRRAPSTLRPCAAKG